MEPVLISPNIHLKVLISVVATTRLLAMWWAHHRRGRAIISGYMGPLRILAVLVMWLFMHIYVLLFFFLPALTLLYVPWRIAAGSPLEPNIAQFEAISEVGTLLAIGANFADVGSTYNHRGFWGHLAHFSLILVPAYCGMMVIVWAITHLFVAFGWSSDSATEAARRLLMPSVLASPIWLGTILVALLVLAIGAGSYVLRTRREKRDGYVIL